MSLGPAIDSEYVAMYGIPAVAGLILLATYVIVRPSMKRLILLAALFTLKPIVTTPILLTVVNPSPTYEGPLPVEAPIPTMQLVLGILLEAGLTALIVVIFRSLFSSPGITVPRFLSALDCIRWLNLLIAPAALFAVSSTDSMGPFMLVWPVAVSMMLIGALLPSILAVTVLAVVVTSVVGKGNRDLPRPQGE